jgi:hypothetical protein
VGWLIECCSRRCLLSSGVLGEVLCDVLPYRADDERAGQAQGPGERPPLVGEVDAPQVEMHGGAPARQAPGRVGDEDVSDRDDTQQGGLSRSNPTAHAGALRALTAGRFRA